MLTVASTLVPSLNIVPGGRPAVVSRAGAVSMKVGLVYSTSEISFGPSTASPQMSLM